ncbi:hypothetical protein C499_13555 [Halogeometricum borinquense DSM 11551]|uniref:Uncharacterized protein n=1 Tax=Halogeometricum borinquense (strain ATCC 700274 / DSM 11551 / JCM 10706 / KCTC 4070 / PR3) TaxID=469382 RepID=L9UKY6_HALBP|nr:hypothetical protein C499_13555 [Halogeometricum borinquense DSM 11551]
MSPVQFLIHVVSEEPKRHSSGENQRETSEEEQRNSGHEKQTDNRIAHSDGDSQHIPGCKVYAAGKTPPENNDRIDESTEDAENERLATLRREGNHISDYMTTIQQSSVV